MLFPISKGEREIEGLLRHGSTVKTVWLFYTHTHAHTQRELPLIWLDPVPCLVVNNHTANTHLQTQTGSEKQQKTTTNTLVKRTLHRCSPSSPGSIRGSIFTASERREQSEVLSLSRMSPCLPHAGIDCAHTVPGYKHTHAHTSLNLH